MIFCGGTNLSFNCPSVHSELFMRHEMRHLPILLTPFIGPSNKVINHQMRLLIKKSTNELSGDTEKKRKRDVLCNLSILDSV